MRKHNIELFTIIKTLQDSLFFLEPYLSAKVCSCLLGFNWWFVMWEWIAFSSSVFCSCCDKDAFSGSVAGFTLSNDTTTGFKGSLVGSFKRPFYSVDS